MNNQSLFTKTFKYLKLFFLIFFRYNFLNNQEDFSNLLYVKYNH